MGDRVATSSLPQGRLELVAVTLTPTPTPTLLLTPPLPLDRPQPSQSPQPSPIDRTGREVVLGPHVLIQLVAPGALQLVLTVVLHAHREKRESASISQDDTSKGFLHAQSSISFQIPRIPCPLSSTSSTEGLVSWHNRPALTLTFELSGGLLYSLFETGLTADLSP